MSEPAQCHTAGRGQGPDSPPGTLPSSCTHTTRQHCLLMAGYGRIWEEVGVSLPPVGVWRLSCLSSVRVLRSGRSCGREKSGAISVGMEFGSGSQARWSEEGGSGSGDTTLDQEHTVLRGGRGRRGERKCIFFPQGSVAPWTPREKAVLKGGSGQPSVLLRAAEERTKEWLFVSARQTCLWWPW